MIRVAPSLLAADFADLKQELNSISDADLLHVDIMDGVFVPNIAIGVPVTQSVAKIAPKGVAKMVSDYGCDPTNILAAIGPGISKCHFETHRDVPDAVREVLPSDEASLCITDHGTGKYHVDLKLVNSLLLQKAGILSEHITIDPECTACHTEKYWSHRLVGNQRGSQIALIQLM